MTIDISPEAVDLLAYRCNELGYKECATTLRALSAALTASQAETAAAYEAAATYLENPTHQGIRPAWGMDIRALTPADSKVALDRMIAEARADGMREAAVIVNADIQKIQPEMTKRAQRLSENKAPGFQYAIHRADLDARISCRDKILAAIPKGKDHE